jgi:hypothetical protein
MQPAGGARPASEVAVTRDAAEAHERAALANQRHVNGHHCSRVALFHEAQMIEAEAARQGMKVDDVRIDAVEDVEPVMQVRIARARAVRRGVWIPEYLHALEGILFDAVASARRRNRDVDAGSLQARGETFDVDLRSAQGIGEIPAKRLQNAHGYDLSAADRFARAERYR